MAEIAATPQDVPVITADPFLPENLMQPHALHEQLREAGPVVYLDQYKIWAMARYEQVNAALKDWETFSSISSSQDSLFASPTILCSRGAVCLSLSIPRLCKE